METSSHSFGMRSQINANTSAHICYLCKGQDLFILCLRLVLLPLSGRKKPDYCRFKFLLFIHPLKTGHNLFLCVHRAVIWRGRSVLWPMQSAPQSIRKTASVMFSTSPPWRPCPASIGLSSNVLAHVVASSGSLSSRPRLRFMSTLLPLERTGPKAACSCRTGVCQQAELRVLMGMKPYCT